MSDDLTRRHFLGRSAALVAGSVGVGMGAAEDLAAAPGGPDYYAPGQRGYETARKPFNADISLQPKIIAACEHDAHVVAAVRRARTENLPIAVKSRGHSFEGYSLNEGGLVIELSRITQPQLLPDGRFIAGPGMTLGAVNDFLLPKGRLLPAGSCSGVGLGGLTLGGGYGLFARQYGLTCDHLERVRMVDGEGRIVDSARDADLLWACQGGGNGNFGAITSLEFRTVPAPAQLSAQRFKAGPVAVKEVLSLARRWFAMADQLPDPIFAALVINGKHVSVLLTSTGPATGPAFQQAAKALTEGGFTANPASRVPLATAIKRYYGVQTPLPFRNFCGGLADGYEDYAPALPEAVAIAQRAGLILQFNTLGGMIARGSAGAYPHRARKYLCEVQAYWEQPAQRQAKYDATEKVRLALGQAVKAHYRNYPCARFPNWEQAYYGQHYGRLQQLKQKYDPGNHFRHPQSVRLPGA